MISAGQLLSILLLWGAFFIMYLRALRRGKMKDSFTRRTWLMFYLGCLAYTLSSENAEQAVDRYVFDWPVGVYVKSLCVILIAHFYYLHIKDMIPRHSALVILLRYLGPVSMGVGIVTFALFIFNQFLPKADLRLWVTVLRDIVIGVYFAGAVIPTTRWMWYQETVPPMRIKHFTGVMFCVSLLVSRLGNALYTLFLVTENPLAAQIEAFFSTSATVYFVTALISFMPHRWLVVAFLPGRIGVYHRLRRLRQKVEQSAQVKMPSGDSILNFFGQTTLELVIYRMVIDILDIYPLLKGRQTPLYDEIQAVVNANPRYTRLVREMAAIKHE